MNICLSLMTKELARKYFSGFVMDPALFAEDQIYQPYSYSQEKADITFDRHCRLGRVYLAIMLDQEPIGEIILKNIDYEQNSCTLGICLQSDQYKNKGYGTAAEILALRYAFHNLDLSTVYADSLLKNTRSHHVLQKVGFSETHRDERFVYYRCDRRSWNDAFHT